MRHRLGRILTGSALAAVTLLGAHTFTTVPASASVTDASGSASTLGNSCNYPTSARPNSTYVSSYSNCKTCRANEFALEYNYWWRDYYCTYNPSNNLNDLHYV